MFGFGRRRDEMIRVDVQIGNVKGVMGREVKKEGRIKKTAWLVPLAKKRRSTSKQ